MNYDKIIKLLTRMVRHDSTKSAIQYIKNPNSYEKLADSITVAFYKRYRYEYRTIFIKD